MGERRTRRADVVAAVAVAAFDLALFVGAGAAAFGWRPAAMLMVAGMMGLIAAHTVVGAREYRAAMGRPWPQVEPVQDDAWDD